MFGSAIWFYKMTILIIAFLLGAVIGAIALLLREIENGDSDYEGQR